LDGTEFDNFDDPRLTNGSPFPPYDYYFPGDHTGCICDFEPIIPGVDGVAPLADETGVGLPGLGSVDDFLKSDPPSFSPGDLDPDDFDALNYLLDNEDHLDDLLTKTTSDLLPDDLAMLPKIDAALAKQTAYAEQTVYLVDDKIDLDALGQKFIVGNNSLDDVAAKAKAANGLVIDLEIPAGVPQVDTSFTLGTPTSKTIVGRGNKYKLKKGGTYTDSDGLKHITLEIDAGDIDDFVPEGKLATRDIPVGSDYTMRGGSTDFTDRESGALHNYQRTGHDSMNATLRSEKATRAPRTQGEGLTIEHQIDRMDEAFKTAPTFENDVTVFRGVGHGALPEEIFEGLHITDHGFVSTSRSPERAARFAYSGRMVELRLPAGTKSIDMSALPNAGEFVNEQEQLLERVTSFKFTGETYRTRIKNTDITVHVAEWTDEIAP